jgi:hypothetical protein
MKRLVVLALLAGCTDPVVDMQIVLPKNADSYDTSCITAVQVVTTGANILTDGEDWRSGCIELEGPATYAAIRDAIRGRFQVAVPDSGLNGVEVYGFSGPSACDFGGDLLFYGRGDYIGQDRIDIPLIHNLDCARSQLRVRMVDMFALAGGATCEVAGTMHGMASAGAGTITPRLYGGGAGYFGGVAWGAATGNLATFAAPTQTAPQSCLAIDGGDTLGGSTSCVVGGTSVCAAPGEIELAYVPYTIGGNSANYDSTLLVKFPGLVYGSVWANGTTKTPLAGAKVTVDPDRGKVFYLDPPDAGGKLPVRVDQSGTGPSGLFALYADSLVDVTVTGNSITREVTLGSANDFVAGAMIVLGP